MSATEVGTVRYMVANMGKVRQDFAMVFKVSDNCSVEGRGVPSTSLKTEKEERASFPYVDSGYLPKINLTPKVPYS